MGYRGIVAGLALTASGLGLLPGIDAAIGPDAVPAFAAVASQAEETADRERWRLSQDDIDAYRALLEADGVVAVAEIAAETAGTLGALRGYDAGDGEEVWAFDLDRFDAPVTGLPAVAGGLILLEGTNDDAQTLYAISPATGEVVWEFEVGTGQYVFVMGEADGTVVFNVRAFAATTVRFVAVDAGTGETVWEAEAEGTITGQLTDAGSGVTYVTLRGLDEELTEQVVAIELETGDALWAAPGGDFLRTVYLDQVTPEVVLLVDVTEEPYTLLALDPETGEEAWSVELPEQTATRTYQVRVAGETVIVLAAEDGETELTGYDAATGEEAWSTDLDAGAAHASVVAEGALVVPVQVDNVVVGLVAIDTGSGDVAWESDLAPLTAVRFADGVVYAAGSSRDEGTFVAALDGESGEVLWDAVIGTPNPATAAGHLDDTLYLSGPDGDDATLVALETD